MNDEDLTNIATSVISPTKLTVEAVAGEVGSALVTDLGNIYMGVSINAACGIGFCAEHNAIGNMLTNNESRIQSIVAVNKWKKIIPPCGRCRELIIQINHQNRKTRVILKDKTVTIEDLLPEPWQDISDL